MLTSHCMWNGITIQLLYLLSLKELRVKLAADRTFSNISFMSYVYNFPLMEGSEAENNPRSDEMPNSLRKTDRRKQSYYRRESWIQSREAMGERFRVILP